MNMNMNYSYLSASPNGKLNNIAILVNIDEDVRVLREIQSSEGFQHRARSLLSLDTKSLRKFDWTRKLQGDACRSNSQGRDLMAE
jgi:hypothetical protein